MTSLLLQLTITFSVFITICIFRRCLQRSQAQQHKFCTREKKTRFWLNNKYTAKWNKTRVWQSDVNRERHNIWLCDYRYPLLFLK